MNTPTKDEILKRWIDLGFLDNLNDDTLKEQLSQKFEELAESILKRFDEDVEPVSTYGFPIVRYLATRGNESQKERVLKMNMDEFVDQFVQYFYKKEVQILKDFCDEF